MKNIESKFPLGQIVATAGVAELMKKDPEFKSFCFESLIRHVDGDWGDLCEEDKQLNNQSLYDRGRILSAYENENNEDNKIWIITESDRSATTILFPDEY